MRYKMDSSCWCFRCAFVFVYSTTIGCNNLLSSQLAVEEAKSFKDRNIFIVLVPNKVVVQKSQDPPKKKDDAVANEVSASVWVQLGDFVSSRSEMTKVALIFIFLWSYARVVYRGSEQNLYKNGVPWVKTTMNSHYSFSVDFSSTICLTLLWVWELFGNCLWQLCMLMLLGNKLGKSKVSLSYGNKHLVTAELSIIASKLTWFIFWNILSRNSLGNEDCNWINRTGGIDF